MAAAVEIYNEGFAKMLRDFSESVLAGAVYDADADRAVGLMLTLGRRTWVAVYEDGQGIEVVGDVYTLLEAVAASGKLIDQFRTDESMRVPKITGFGVLIDLTPPPAP